MEIKKTIQFLLLLIASSCKTGLITDELKKGVAISEKIDFSKWEILYQIEYEGGRIYYPCMGDNNPPLKQRIIVADKTLGKEKK
jgi:hypothetical protein